MGAFLGISLWVALATVVPGLITLTLVFFAFVVADHPIINPANSTLLFPNDWITAGAAVTVMILTQALGILLEKLLVDHQWFPNCTKLKVPKGFCSDEVKTIDAYDQYEKLYILLAQLTEHEDSQGHLKRSSAQFFLTNNTIVSFTVAFIVTLCLAFSGNYQSAHLYYYAINLFVDLLIIYYVAVIRFRVMAKSIWATNVARKTDNK